MTLKEVKPIPLDPNNVKRVLDDAAEREFSSIIIFGYKDDMVSIMKSGIIGKIEVIGALEVAKQNLWME